MPQAVSNPITRRSVFAGAAALSAILSCVPAVADGAGPDLGHPDIELLKLGARLKTAWEACNREQDDDAVLDLFDRCRDLVESIGGRAAQTLDGYRVQAFAVLWCCDGRRFSVEHVADQDALGREIAEGIINGLISSWAIATIEA